MKKSLKGFTLVEMLIVIVAVGIIGSMTARLLIQGSDIFVGETNRQSFMNEVRFAFWRVMRESHGQVSKEQFFSSTSKDMYLKHSNGNNKQIEIDSFNNITLDQDGNKRILTNYYSPLSEGVTYYDSNFEIINQSESGLTEAQAKEIQLIKVNLNFYNNQDTTSLSSYIYPPNFDYGEKSGFHD